MEHATRIEVRYAETDKMGIVYHANYLVWLEVARAHFLDSLGFPYAETEKQGFMAPVLSVEVTYGSPFTYGDVAMVYTFITKLSPVRVEYSYRIYAEGEDPLTCKPRLSAKTTHCLVDAKTFRPVSQKKMLPELYAAYQSVLIDD